MSPWILLGSAPAIAVILAVLMVRRRFIVVRVSGRSMSPGLLPGDRVLVRCGSGLPVRAGAIVVFPQPATVCRPGDDHRDAASARTGGELVIKRVAAVPGDPVPGPVRQAVGGATVVPAGMFVALGDNTRSMDSRTWGFLPAGQVVGTVTRQLSRARAAGSAA